MFDFTSGQLPLQPFDNNADRPLPELIAEGNPDPETGWAAFPLASHDVEGIRYYLIQDWISGVAQTDRPRKVWDDLKRRSKRIKVSDTNGQLITLSDLLSGLCQSLPHKTSSGRTYQMDFGDEATLFLIVQRIGVETVIRDRIMRYLDQAGVVLDKYRIEALQSSQSIDEPITDDPDKALEAVINTYKRMGRSDRWIAIRIQSTVQRKRFTEAFQQALRVSPSSFQFAEITDTIRIGLWKRDTQQLRKEMGLDAKANVRDHGTEIMLTYEMLTEQVSEFDLRKSERMEYEQAKRIVRTDSEFIGKQAKVTSQHLGIDIPTGRPLLPGKTKQR